MPVSLSSRYAGLTAAPAPDGGPAGLPIRRHRTLAPSTPRTQYRITGAETLESIAARYFGRSEEWWRIADANPLKFPLDWRPGDVLTITSAEDPGRVVRDRRF
jgi:nucleoid-associated protein YgaU